MEGAPVSLSNRIQFARQQRRVCMLLARESFAGESAVYVHIARDWNHALVKALRAERVNQSIERDYALECGT
jgi:hypothetical protein